MVRVITVRVMVMCYGLWLGLGLLGLNDGQGLGLFWGYDYVRGKFLR